MLICLVLTIHVSIVTNERAFSVIKIIKPKLRNKWKANIFQIVILQTLDDKY